ncbi:MAG: hypothetical protein WKF30_04200 [Pyrinomonadaceae bacterium]
MIRERRAQKLPSLFVNRMRLLSTATLWLMLALAACQHKAQVNRDRAEAAPLESAAPAAQQQQQGSTPATHDRNALAYYTYEIVNTYPHDAARIHKGSNFTTAFSTKARAATARPACVKSN